MYFGLKLADFNPCPSLSIPKLTKGAQQIGVGCPVRTMNFMANQVSRHAAFFVWVGSTANPCVQGSPFPAEGSRQFFFGQKKFALRHPTPWSFERPRCQQSGAPSVGFPSSCGVQFGSFGEDATSFQEIGAHWASGDTGSLWKSLVHQGPGC